MSRFYNPQHQGWKEAQFAAIVGSRIQPNPYPVGSSAWEDYERGAQYYKELRTWEGRGKTPQTAATYSQYQQF